jgi:hypothetical protein
MIAAERSKRSWPDSLLSGPITDLPLRSSPIRRSDLGNPGQGWGRRVTRRRRAAWWRRAAALAALGRRRTAPPWRGEGGA